MQVPPVSLEDVPTIMQDNLVLSDALVHPGTLLAISVVAYSPGNTDYFPQNMSPEALPHANRKPMLLQAWRVSVKTKNVTFRQFLFFYFLLIAFHKLHA